MDKNCLHINIFLSLFEQILHLWLYCRLKYLSCIPDICKVAEICIKDYNSENSDNLVKREIFFLFWAHLLLKHLGYESQIHYT